MPYAVPGRADQLDDALVAIWNEVITAEFTLQRKEHGSRFVTADPDTLIGGSPADIRWFADPAVSVRCVGRSVARRLADYPVLGRQKVQDEYAEYAVDYRSDDRGRARPKRVQITTELREYWVTVAGADPEALARMAEDVLGYTPDWEELYGVADPHSLSAEERESAFIRLVAGADGQPPAGQLNRKNALFMTHPINGLDDLVYIVVFGARPHGVRQSDGARRPATRDELFSRAPDTRILACRHADPVAALSAHAAAWQGRTVAFADPLGVYIKGLDDAALSLDGAPVPEDWFRWSRGAPGLRQHLVIGPPDDDPRFLDDITVSVGAANEPLVGGFQVLALMEVGPLIAVGAPSTLADQDVVDIPARTERIDCTGDWACKEISALVKELGGNA